MTIAGSIILIMLGAILTWAVDFTIVGLDIQVIGVILMVGGLAGLLFGIWRLTTARRRTTVTTAAPMGTPAATHRQQVYEEQRYSDPI
ncbi:DUF6458 family protein [Microbispora sp. H11081]|uniref:DUF6458 family protein n=1 Tax=Microbispora sp. H11081 TaxID=2729107 RepID=UPI001474A0BC|nr:DUF6458 family protein [Microbispora sp. H11081]